MALFRCLCLILTLWMVGSSPGAAVRTGSPYSSSWWGSQASLPIQEAATRYRRAGDFEAAERLYQQGYEQARRHDTYAMVRYLASIGVPLFVWSLTGPRPELTAAWGEVLDVSDQGKLRVATDLLKKNIAAQRIAWLDTDPIHALRATVKAWCGLAMVGKSE